MTEPDRVVAQEDGKPGCPQSVWLDGVYRTRCSFGVDDCHRHGPFAVTREFPPCVECGHRASTHGDQSPMPEDGALCHAAVTPDTKACVCYGYRHPESRA